MARIARPWYSAEKACYMAYVGGKKVRLVKGGENPTNHLLAAKKLREILRVRKANPGLDRVRQSVASVIEQYLRLNRDRYSPAAFEERRYYLQLFAEAHGWRGVNDRDCLPVHVQQFLADHPEWKSDWTRAHVVHVLMRPFNWAAKNRLIPSNPFRGVEQGPGEPRRPLTDEEFQALLRASGAGRRRFRPTGAKKKQFPSDLRRKQRPSSAARFRMVLIFLRFTGARPGELCWLEWSDIDLKSKVIVLRRHKTSRKTGRPRVIPLHPVVLKLLIVLRRLGQPGGRVFLTFRKTPWNRSNLSLRIRRARAAAGVPGDAKLYGLRHAFGTRSVLNGVDIKTLAELMGHTTTRMTEHYLHLSGHGAHLAGAMLRANARRPAS